ncbi:MAG: family 43 glycosylhydrolase [Staphylococcus sp.]|nr:family 43 glycosylhydrolase [Staphylococcus sp.]
MKLSRLLISALTVTAGTSLLAMNPYLPLWEHIPDGEPYVFDDPDNPGKKRVYIFGSHDMIKWMYCGYDLVTWSAPVDSLENWRYDGVIFESQTDANGHPLRANGLGDVLYAPDIAERTLPDSKKEYWLFPNNQAEGRNGMVARADRPDGPYKPTNFYADNPDASDGVLRFDPAVFIDDDNRVYGYWGFGKTYAAELDPKTMATVKPGTEIVENLMSGFDTEGIDRFYEASSIRKIKDKYVFIFSRVSADGEWGLPASNYTLAYAYGDNPLGPFTYGGTIIDARGRDTDADGKPMATATVNGNTHGSIQEVNGQWYVFYHRQTGLDEYARQAMVAPIDVDVEEGPGGKVTISEAEYTSEGFETAGLDPLRRYPAAIASHFTGPTPAYQKYPVMHYSGPYFEPAYISNHNVADPYDEELNVNNVVNCTDGSILGYKYFNFDSLHGKNNPRLTLWLTPQRIDGKIEIYTSAPWKGNPKPIGEIILDKDMPTTPGEFTTNVKEVTELNGKHPLYFTFSSPEKGKSIATITHLQFNVTD